jgi:hypothetical protein
MERVVSTLTLISLLALAVLEGSLVALPKPEALAGLERLRSPAWAAALPGSILIGTFAPLWQRPFATAFIALSAVVTPLLAVVAAAGVSRGPRNLLLAGVVVAFALALALGPRAELAASIVTAFGCMALGVALTRLIPRRWLYIGVVAMACLDVLLLAVHVGQQPATVMADASARFHGRSFNAATIGPITLGYPDLVSAGVLGGFVAGGLFQRRAALTLTLLAAASGMLLAVIDMVPSTPPIAATFVLVAIWERAAVRHRRRESVAPATRLASALSFASPRGGGAAGSAMRHSIPASGRPS